MTDQLRKVAVLVNALDSESAKVLLGQMSTDQARKVRETLKKMGKIDPQEQLAVLQNFSEEQKTATQKKATTSKGFSVEEEFQQSDFSALQKTLSSDYLPTNPLSSQPSHQELPQDESLRMPDPIDRVSEDPSRLQPSYYAASYQTISPNTLTSETSQGARQEVAANEIEQEDLFDNIDFQTVLPLVEKEHPQAIAVIISQLSPKRGGELLALLPTTLQTEVVRRLADMEEADPAIVQDLCQSITSQLKNYSSSEEELPTGSHILKKIMSSCGNDLQQQILRSLGEEGTTGRALRKEFGSKFPPSMLEPLSTLPFGQGSGDSSMKVARAANSQEIDRQNVPEGRDAAAKVDLTLLKKFSSADLVSLFQQCHTKIALLALVGAEEPLVARVLRQFPRRQQRLFRKQMDTIGSVSLREIQLAQQEVFLLAQKMLGQVEGLQKEASSRKEIIAQKKKQKGNSKGKSELAMAG